MLLHMLFWFVCVLNVTTGHAILPASEVELLKVIARTLKKTNWNFNVNPCSGSSGWVDPNPENGRGRENEVTCDCTFHNSTVCHVVSIVLKSQNLSGSVPPELTGLPFIREIDLTRNYLNGTIPPEWGSTTLVNISLFGNRITGPIPKELGNISTLANLELQYNLLSGTIPPELGRLSRMEKLVITSNNLTGEIPEDLANLATLKDFRISDNNFTGNIPTFIQNWTNIETLVIQGSGLSGPIPPDIASLSRLTDLRISDLSGNVSKFPPLINMKKIKYIILRSCNIVGQLPSYIGEMTELKLLDLSFNKLEGPIPESFGRLVDIDYIYLSGNSLSGQVPSWMVTEGNRIDISYNNLTSAARLDPTCRSRDINLFASSRDNTSGYALCIRSLPCHKNYTSLHVNCGGRQVVDDEGNTYEDDSDSGGPTHLYSSMTNWGYSSTGHFLDSAYPTEYIWSSNSSIFGQNSQLYKDARLSPLSLTYFMFCMMNGNYTISLHFAEIMFTDDNTYSSLGRRIFDVFVQRKLVLKDFNIANAAGGVNKGIIKKFTAVVVDNTLSFRLYWAGKGTTGIPAPGVYGPLISAISINPNFVPPSENGNNLSLGGIVGVVVAGLCATILVLAFLWWKDFLGCKDVILHDLKGLSRHTRSFSLRKIKAATNNFDPANKIGEGGFGPVYKGQLSNGTIIAVKKLSSKSKQGNREFVNEIGMISALQHPHLVKLYGCCVKGNQLLLVYEYMENNNLARALFGPEEQQLHLDWPVRHKICIGVARGLTYLHEESRLKIVHRDIKATNVLLDKNLVAKISDFGLAKLHEGDSTHITTKVAGTIGYMAPEYAMRGHLTDKADVYSFGIVLLEIVNGRSNTSIRPKEACFNLLDYAKYLREKGNLLELVDSRLESNFDENEVMTVIKLVFHCTNAVAAERPSMSTVVSILEGNDGVYEFDDSNYINKMNYNEMTMNHGDGQNVSSDVQYWTASCSTSTDDLHEVRLISEQRGIPEDTMSSDRFQAS